MSHSFLRRAIRALSPSFLLPSFPSFPSLPRMYHCRGKSKDVRRLLAGQAFWARRLLSLQACRDVLRRAFSLSYCVTSCSLSTLALIILMLCLQMVQVAITFSAFWLARSLLSCSHVLILSWMRFTCFFTLSLCRLKVTSIT